jgi:hypothetical protein
MIPTSSTNDTQPASEIYVLNSKIMATYDPVGEAFENAKRDFQDRLDNPALYDEILKTSNIDQVYDFTDKLQKEQAEKGHLRHLSRIQPYLERLREYTGVVDTFVQVKPGVLALIWGPIRLLIQWSSVLKGSLDEIVSTTAKIGYVLPQFQEVTRLFSSYDRIKDFLFLFFKDILDFYLIAFEFFSKKRTATLPHEYLAREVELMIVQDGSTCSRLSGQDIKPRSSLFLPTSNVIHIF